MKGRAPMHKVITRLTGGFGNQCFLYAAGRGLALKYGARLVLLDMYKPGDQRQFALGDFNCKYEHKVRNGRITRRISAWLHAKRLPMPRQSTHVVSGTTILTCVMSNCDFLSILTVISILIGSSSRRSSSRIMPTRLPLILC